MLSKNIKYTDYNGVEREETFLFNLSKAELMEMEMGTTGGLAEMIKKIISTQDTPTIMDIFKKIILKAYGEKSADGKRFIKTGPNGRPLSEAFAETEAYSELYMELSTNAEAAAKFVNGIMPKEVADKAAALTPEEKSKILPANFAEQPTNN
ncbi:hypothetical protein [uncultured Eubacterium sp.]|jgi:hypothetical protein|uniref:hypothetical protein n=1 Tax=uncultured Eubacterium sp. TaxID=165185 RepID=UPI002594B805|nr:hypothetical protein [uncultured Eubacterium sp.]